jgi:threonyl-tRNA synthetase
MLRTQVAGAATLKCFARVTRDRIKRLDPSHIRQSQFKRNCSSQSNSHNSGDSPLSTASPISLEVASIATRQKLYMIDPTSPGSVFFLPHGTRIFNKLIEFMKIQQKAFKFEEVITPLIYKHQLWKTSGHWEHYRNDMFQVFGADHSESTRERLDSENSHGSSYSENAEFSQYGLKPMNCPGHCLIFSRFDRTYKELPLRLSDFSPLHRNESSGALSGLTRVRKFHQDDGHIFCTPDQVRSEMRACLTLVDTVYQVFGLTDYRLTLSTRPDSFIGSKDIWDAAEENLKESLAETGKQWSVNPGDGAFYGPKIDVLVKDNTGKEHQLATIQLDFQLPKNFELKYSNKDNAIEQPVMIHRAIFGSLERFFALLIDHYKGAWPFWLNPRQAAIIPVAARHYDKAVQLGDLLGGTTSSLVNLQEASALKKLSSRSFHVEVLGQDSTVGHRIRQARDQGFSYILMIGDKELDSDTVSVKAVNEKETKVVTAPQLVTFFHELEDRYA